MTPEGTPAMIIFNNGGNDKQTANLTFVNGGYYAEQGTLRAIVGSATGIGNVTTTLIKDDGAWYDLHGCRLPGEPTKKGVYIHQGKKVLVK